MASGTPLPGVSSDYPWTQPPTPSLQHVGAASDAEASRTYPCSWLTYRLYFDLGKTIQTGCFIRTAYGLLDPDHSTVIFNGTDEAHQLRFGGWPVAFAAAETAIRFDGFAGLGSYMYFYPGLSGNLDNGGDMFGPHYKSITSLPNTVFVDTSGEPLAVNPLAIGFDTDEQWIVTENPAHALIRINVADHTILPFAKSFFIPGQPYANHKASLAISEDGRFVAVASGEFRTLTIYDLASCQPAASIDPLTPQRCQSYNYWPLVAESASGTLSTITQTSFLHNGLLSFIAKTSTGNQRYLLSPSEPATSLLPYLGLGDSYASGQGAWNYLAGTDTTTNHCHLSVHSYPLRLADASFTSSGRSVACSGARMRDIGNQSGRYRGQNSDQVPVAERRTNGSEQQIIGALTTGYLPQISFVNHYQPGVITVQIGGNDVGFKDMLLRCVSPLASIVPPALNPNDCYASYEDRLEVTQTIDRFYPEWLQLFEKLRRSAPHSRLYVIGYPQIISANGRCGLNAPLSAGDIDFARSVIPYINKVIAKAAVAAGVQYVDITNALEGHELCNGSQEPLAVNGITAGNDSLGILGQESFHPTAFGHELIAEAIRIRTHNFTAGDQPPADGSTAILQAPPSGRAVRSIIPETKLTMNNLVTAGSKITITASGLQYGLRANTPYDIKLNGYILGRATTDAGGNIHTTLTIPSSLKSGVYQLSIDGSNINDSPISIVGTIGVVGSASVTLTFGITSRARLGR